MFLAKLPGDCVMVFPILPKDTVTSSLQVMISEANFLGKWIFPLPKTMAVAEVLEDSLYHNNTRVLISPWWIFFRKGDFFIL